MLLPLMWGARATCTLYVEFVYEDTRIYMYILKKLPPPIPLSNEFKLIKINRETGTNRNNRHPQHSYYCH